MATFKPDGCIGGMYFMDEERLWFELDKIATVEAGTGGNKDKSNAAVAMMRWLKRPSHEQCRQMFIEDGS